MVWVFFFFALFLINLVFLLLFHSALNKVDPNTKKVLSESQTEGCFLCFKQTMQVTRLCFELTALQAGLTT